MSRKFDSIMEELLQLSESFQEVVANCDPRRACASEGHKYRVHGKTTPTKVSCGRCDASWSVGQKTESAL